MATIRELVLGQLRRWRMTTIFGDPGSTEASFAHDLPADFRYVLGLQEAVVVGMADAHAQVTGTPTLVNLHGTAGLGDAMGAIVNAARNKSPLVITAGGEGTPHSEPLFAPTAVKWVHEPHRAEDVPAALARARLIADTPPRGPVILSLPAHDLDTEVDEARARAAETLAERHVAVAAAGDPQALAALAERLTQAEKPALICGSEIDADGTWEDAVALAERLRTPVWSAPAESRATFPQDHWLYQGALPPDMGPLDETLDGHDLVVVLGAPVFRRRHPVPGDYPPAGTTLVQLTSDPGEAARAPFGDAVIADVGYALQTLLDLIEDPKQPNPRAEPAERRPLDPGGTKGSPLDPAAVFTALARSAPAHTRWVHEAPTHADFFPRHVKLTRPGSYFAAADGGSGFGLPAAVAAQLADPSRPVIGLIGDGPVQYAVCALWTAAAYRVPVTIVVTVDGESAFPGAPGRGIDVSAIATGYGVRAHRAVDAVHLASLLEEATTSKDGPTLIEVPVRTVFPGTQNGRDER
ncbi:benzoylformate decarboxylase [Phytomonospora endophytica]|uniref:Benzoylformate decarboxylase n=1 Tax=Phytomonospora endophytica TaxID=714109 RepID=A0A841FI66_9ACTN|nr:benzoylformate decarboxylase [Phytomonospora endophytica]MBB6034653.1 benzoylformate decarboxylase [Phytomonospora endophytica]GIG69146.1 benzoylformate decarboxylase [Phytomonospora endophytica]